MFAVLYASGCDFPPGDHRRYHGICNENGGCDRCRGKNDENDAQVQRQ